MISDSASSPSPFQSALSHGPGRTFPELSAGFLREYAGKIRIAVQPLSQEQIWWRRHEHCNSIGNLILHICGNVRLWLLATIGGEPFQRDRDQEFSARDSATGGELLDELDRVIRRCEELLSKLPDALETRYSVQGYEADGWGVIYHVVEHMSYHTGQIVDLAKQQLDDGSKIDFYPQHDGE